jgi:hypothetical protein
MYINNIKRRRGIGHNQSPGKYEGVFFTYGKMYINHFYEISKFGVNALRMYQYIRTMQGLRYKGIIENSHLPIRVDNKKLYEWFGVGPNKKWEVLNKLEDANIIKLKRNGKGRLPEVKIVLAKKKLN